MSDKIREAFKVASDAAGIKDGTDRLALWAWWLKAWQAALAQQPAQAAPDGWKLVPVEPTIDMEDAGRKAASGFMRLGEAGRVFRAMLAASPAAPAPAPAPAAQEPVAWLRDDGDGDLGFSASEDGFPVYAAPPAAEQPDTVKVPRELLKRLVDVCADAGAGYARKELVALLGKEGEA